ncbi:type I DNA topoisomerase [soil metagenome]
MNVVVVESPAKAKTINKYLGPDYTVLASYGHVRDLPPKDGSVRPDDDFAMDWEVDAKSSKRLSDIADAMKGATRLILATDPDREGEAISWHVLEVLKKKRAIKDMTVQRVTFNALTKQAVLTAMAAPRDIDMELVDAYLARRALDYLVGFSLSPVLWRKLPGAKSAGRVQSVALRLIVDREVEIDAFQTREYWSVEADVSAGSDPVLARLTTHEGKKRGRYDLPDEAAAHAARSAVQAGSFTVSSVEKKPAKRSPAPPFTTSTLQQEASRKLGFNAQRTMSAAQKLYEGVDENGGLINYMRTDGVSAAPEAIAEARHVIAERFGAAYVPETPRYYKVKAKNAQEAHEAIRPTSLNRHPSSLRLEGDLGRLYELIWRRMAASQMESARIERTTIDLTTPDSRTALRATGQVIQFDGYLAVYEEGRDDAPKGEEDDDARLPVVNEGATAKVAQARADQHFTEPPPRYSEASLVKKMEELGIGRPSTYASILERLRDRSYVRMDKNRFIPEDSGRLLIAFLAQYFAKYVEYYFTADLEDQLDQVSAGDMQYKVLLRRFWDHLNASIHELDDVGVREVIDALDESLGPWLFPDSTLEGSNPRTCPACGDGRLGLKISRNGAFVGCSRYPDCRYTRRIGGEDGAAGDRELGAHPDTGRMISLKIGRFGPYVDEAAPEGDKPRRSSLPKGWSQESMDLDRALRLLSLPREVGKHPEDGETILAGLGRFGPYVQHGKTYASVADIDEAFDIGLNRAVTLIAEKRAGGPRGRGAATPPLKELGNHPVTGEPMVVMAGRYGAYVKSGAVNATLPKGATPESLTAEEAVTLIDARAAAGGGGKSKAKRAPAKSAKPAAKKAPAKKAAAKKKA